MIASLWRAVRTPRVSWCLRLALSALLLILLFTQVDLATVLANLARIDPRSLVAVLALYCALNYMWAVQMWLALKPLQMRFPIGRLFAILLISTFYSLVLPGNVIAGGAVSWYKLSRSQGRRAEVGALLVYVRLIDTLVLLGLGLAGVWFDPHFSSWALRAVVGAMFAGVVVVALPFFSAAVTRRLERLGAPLARRLSLPGPVRDKAEAVWRALQAFQTLDRRTIALIFGLSAAGHGLAVVIFYLLALALDIQLSIVVLGWIRALVGIIQLIPFSIAGLGVREVSLVLLLRDYGIAESQALTFSLAIFGLAVVGGLAGAAFEAHDLLSAGMAPKRP